MLYVTEEFFIYIYLNNLIAPIQFSLLIQFRKKNKTVEKKLNKYKALPIKLYVYVIAAASDQKRDQLTLNFIYFFMPFFSSLHFNQQQHTEANSFSSRFANFI